MRTSALTISSLAAAFICFVCTLFCSLTAKAQLTVFAGNDTAVKCNTPITISPVITPAGASVTHNWSLLSSTTTGGYTATNPAASSYTITFSKAGTYVFLIKVTSSTGEARDEISFTVSNCTGGNSPQQQLTDVKYKRMFSPNNDNINDTWKLEGITRYTGITVIILNPHGKVIYTLENPASETIWDGRVQGKDMPVDTYYFIIKQNGQQVLADNFTLLR